MTLPSTAAAAPDRYGAFYARLNPAARANVDRHLSACESDPTGNHPRLWKRLAGLLAELSPHSVSITGQKAVQFFRADGVYRRQLFALEDLRDGKLSLYLEDVLEAARRRGVLEAELSPFDDATSFALGGAPNELLAIERLTAAATTSAPDYYRHLLGWNRRAIRVTVPTTASAAQVRAVESLCALAANGSTSERPNR